MNNSVYKVGDLAEVQTGPFGSQLHQKDYVPSGTPLITVKNIGENRMIENGLDFVSEKDTIRLKKFLLKENDIVFSRVGAVDRRVFITQKYVGWMFSGSCLRIRVVSDKLNPRYLSYYLGSKYFTDYISRIAVGATRPSLNTEILSNIEVPLPSLIEQNKIASILSSLDEKFELNMEMNKTLEEMAMAIYKEWFVDFGPFKDGEFVDSELGLIPKGWEVIRLGDAVETLGGGTPKTSMKEYWEDGTINWYSPTDLTKANSLFSVGSEKKITNLGLSKSSAKLFPPYSLLMTSRATIGEIAINRTEASTNQGFITLIPNDKIPVFQLVGWVKQNMGKIKSIADGSTFPEISKGELRDFKILVSSDIRTFIELNDSIYKLIESNIVENKALKETRDYLLPKLINGEISVKEADEKAKNVI